MRPCWAEEGENGVRDSRWASGGEGIPGALNSAWLLGETGWPEDWHSLARPRERRRGLHTLQQRPACF